MFFTGATVAGDPTVANEDWSAATPDLVVMLDGATARTETGCRHGPAWYTRRLGAAVIAGATGGSAPLSVVLADAIQEVAALHPECDLGHPGTPSAGIAIVHFEESVLRYLVLGDVTIVLDTTVGVKSVSDQRISATASKERREADKYLIGSAEKAHALLAMKQAELAARNQPDGYWIAATDPSVVNCAITGAVEVATTNRFAVLTDGAARAIDLFNLYGSWRATLDAVENLGVNRFLDRIRATELSDPLGVAYPRNKVSDDATVLLARLGTKCYKEPNPVVEPQLSQEERIRLATDFLDRTVNAPGVYGDGMRQRVEAERAAGG